MRLQLPPGLRFPITVTELLKQPTDNVAPNEPLFKYDFKTTVQEDDYLGDTRIVTKTFPGVFESDIDGILSDWFIRVGQVIRGPLELAEIEEPCTHEVQFHGICAICGKDMTELTYNKQHKDTTRASINMVHDDVNLKISTSEASRSEEEVKRRLIASKRLSLVVDLDQTIIHATVDPTVGEWQNDPSNPNHPAVADVKAFQLTDDGPSSRSCWYYIKARPGLNNFLERVSELFELHIYTMGTRSYAGQVAKIVDPEGNFFADRILSRDESGSLTAKSLQRLFPIDTKMVVIIDDRGDVWRWNDNLIRVTPYDFFVGIGDINSSFLPQRPKIQATLTSAESKDIVSDGSDKTQDTTADSASTLEQLVSMGGGDDPEKLKDRTEKAAQAIDSQLEQRPLLQKQIALEKQDVGAEVATQQSEETNNPELAARERHHLLEDHDSELIYLERSLRQVHHQFYDEYSQRLARRQERIKDTLEPVVRNVHDTGTGIETDLSILPDIKVVMPDIKRRVLENVSIVFSGVVPLGVDVLASDIAIWATSFGATIRLNVSRRRTTHVVAARKGTLKVKQALRYGKGRISVVSTQWLMDSIVRWKRQEETPYLLHNEADEISPADPRTGIEEDDADVLSDSEEPLGEDAGLTDGDTTDAEQERRATGLRLRVKTSKLNDLQNNQRVGYEGDEALELSPVTPFDDQSPIGNAFDWQDMEDDLADFMGDSDEEESDDYDDFQPAKDESTKKHNSKAETVTSLNPRKRQSDDEEVNKEESAESEYSPPRKKYKEELEENLNDTDDSFEDDFEKAFKE